jgi:hypothetical protein
MKIVKPEEKDIFIPTACISEVIRLTDWYEVDSEKEPTKVIFWQLCLSLYDGMNCGPERPLKDRLRHIWHIIKNRSPWKDQILLDVPSAKKLRDKLTEMIERAEKNIAP